MLGPILDLLVGIAGAIAALMVALAGYLAVANRTRELGVIKALGASRRFLAAEVLAEVAILCGAALVIGVALAGAVAAAIESSAPDYRVSPWSLAALARATVVGVGLAAVGALAPLWSLARIDPAEAFRK